MLLSAHLLCCNSGHGFSEDPLLEAMMEKTGELIWQVTRGLQETAMLLSHMGQHLQEAGETASARDFSQRDVKSTGDPVRSRRRR